jgi:hypothetical protein
MDYVKGRYAPFGWREGRVKDGNRATGSQYQVCVLGEQTFYWNGYRARRVGSWSANVYISEELQPRVRSSFVELVSTILNGVSALANAEFTPTRYLDFRMIRSDTIPHKPVG